MTETDLTHRAHYSFRDICRRKQDRILHWDVDRAKYYVILVEYRHRATISLFFCSLLSDILRFGGAEAVLVRQKVVALAEKGFAVLVLLLTAGALINSLLYQESEFGSYTIEGDPSIQAMWLAIYGVTLLLLVLRWKHFIGVATSNKLLLLLLGIALISVLWSAVPEVTLRRSVALAGTTLFGVYLAARFSLSEQLRLVAWALGIAALTSFVVALILPSFGISSGGMGGEGWRGVFDHKNNLGRLMTLSTLVFLLLAVSSRRYRWIAWAGFGLSVSLVLLSNSATALVVFLALLTLLPLNRALQWRHILVVPFLIGAMLLGVCIVVWLLSNADTLLDFMGKDVTLSGRTELWSAVVDMIGNCPWLGYGYSGFWLGREGGSAYVLLVTLSNHPHAHNGFLDLWLDLGLLGVSVFTLGFFLTFVRAISWVRLSRTTEGLWPITYLMFMLLYNTTETTILVWNNVFWVLYVTTTLSLSIGPKWQSKASRIRLTVSEQPRGLTVRPVHQ